MLHKLNFKAKAWSYTIGKYRNRCIQIQLYLLEYNNNNNNKYLYIARSIEIALRRFTYIVVFYKL